MDVELETVGAQREAVIERRQRVLRAQGGAAAVRENLRASEAQRGVRPWHRLILLK
jgi:hypothetical protein